MNSESERQKQRGESFLLWLIRKIAPALFIGGVIGCVIGLLAAQNSSLLRILSLVAAVVFTILSLLYFYGATQSTNGGGYKYSVLDRIGIAISGLAALTMASKLAFPQVFLGEHFLYLLFAIFLAFVVRPILDRRGFNKSSCEQGSASNTDR